MPHATFLQFRFHIDMNYFLVQTFVKVHIEASRVRV